MKVIKVEIDKKAGKISVYNDGRGIPIEKHSKEKVYVPELIFGHLLTSSNYDDKKKKVITSYFYIVYFRLLIFIDVDNWWPQWVWCKTRQHL